ncbi:MAG TPA: hypothetical protein VGW09_11425 [Nitrososphaeraceae archaeon]|nr:hypothetical protein [Nitrososphaeraceae archaeon]
MVLTKIASTIVTMPSRDGRTYFAFTSRLVIIEVSCRPRASLLIFHENELLIYLGAIRKLVDAKELVPPLLRSSERLLTITSLRVDQII